MEVEKCMQGQGQGGKGWQQAPEASEERGMELAKY